MCIVLCNVVCIMLCTVCVCVHCGVCALRACTVCICTRVCVCVCVQNIARFSQLLLLKFVLGIALGYCTANNYGSNGHTSSSIKYEQVNPCIKQPCAIYNSYDDTDHT